MSRSISRRVLLFSRGFCSFPAVSATEGANLKADLSEKADNSKYNLINLIAIARKANLDYGEPFYAEKAAKGKTKHNGSKKQEVPIVSHFGKEDVAMVEKALGYHFKDSTLVGEALTHESYYYPSKLGLLYNYERLGLVGDALINMLFAEMAFAYPFDGRCQAAKILCAKNLACIAVNNGLHYKLRHNMPQLDKQIGRFMSEVKDYVIDSRGLFGPPGVLPHIVKSLLGAIFVDSDNSFPVVQKVFRRLLRAKKPRKGVHQPEEE